MPKHPESNRNDEQAAGGTWQRLAALSLVMLLPSLGTSIANVALPTLAATFDASLVHVQWTVLAYLLAVTTLVVAAGRMGDILGKRRVLLAGIAIFVAGSAACAMAPTLWTLVVARSVQGAGAAGMMTLTIALIGDLVPKARTGSAIGLLGTVSAMGTALGPSLGGVLIAVSGWHAVFALLAAVGGIALLAVRRTLPMDRPATQGQAARFDLAGLGLLACGLVSFTLLLTLGGSLTMPLQAALSVFAILGSAAFLWHQSVTPAPLVRVSLLRDRRLASGLLSLWMVSGIVMTTLVVGPFYLSEALSLGPVQIGAVMSTGPVVAALAGLPAGRLVDRTGPFAISAGGLAIVATGAVLMTFLPAAQGTAGYVAALVVLTTGYALFQAANTTHIMSGAVAESRGVASALIGLSRNLGLISGAAVMGTVFASFTERGRAPGAMQEPGAGLAVVFGLAAGLAILALAVNAWGHRQRQALT